MGMKPRRRVAVGKLLVVLSLALFALWLNYFVSLVRTIDLFDYAPLPLVVVLVLMGVRLVRVGTSQLMRLSAIFPEK